jgi:hypothetical protein
MKKQNEYERLMDDLNLIDEQAESGSSESYDEKVARGKAYDRVANFIDNYSAKYRFVKQQIKANTKDIKCVVNNTQFVESVMEAMDRRDLPSNDPYPLINKGVEYFSGRMMEIPRGFLSGSSLKDNFGTLDVINWNLKNYLYGRINFLSCEKKNFDKIKR